jgi:hypothetical protein
MWTIPAMDVRPALIRERSDLLDLVVGLSDDEWFAPTRIPGWSVKDLALHILDDDLGWLSRGRAGDPSGRIDTDTADFVAAEPQEPRLGAGGSAAEPSRRRRTAGMGRAADGRPLREPVPRRRRSCQVGERRAGAELVRHRSGPHRAVGAPDADARRHRQGPLISRRLPDRGRAHLRVGHPAPVPGRRTAGHQHPARPRHERPVDPRPRRRRMGPGHAQDGRGTRRRASRQSRRRVAVAQRGDRVLR